MLKPEKFNINSFSVKTAEIAGISLRDCIKTVVRYKELSVAETKSPLWTVKMPLNPPIQASMR